MVGLLIWLEVVLLALLAILLPDTCAADIGRSLHFGPEQGLAHNTTNSLLQDREKQFWKSNSGHP